MSDDSQMPSGQAAIEAALDNVYGKDTGMVLHRPIPKFLGGPDVIDDFYVHKVDAPVPHWHLVTAGLTELYDKQSEDKDVSGFGFELSIRVKCLPGEESSPNWASNFMENVAKYAYETGCVFDDGHTMNLNGPMEAGSTSDIRAMVMRTDPALGEIQSPNGRLKFLQIVGITLDELHAMKGWDSDGVLKEVLVGNGLGIIDLDRKSILTDPAAACRIREQTAAHGSSTALMHEFGEPPSVKSGWLARKRLVVKLPALDIDKLGLVVRGRIPFGRPLMVLFGDGPSLMLLPAESCSWRQKEEDFEMSLTAAAATDLADRLLPKAGEFVIPPLPDVTWIIEKTVIRDQDGSPAETVG